MSFSPNLVQLWRAAAVPNGTYNKPMQVAPYTDVCLQWVHPIADGTARATFQIYASPLPFDDERLNDTDPTTNPYWTLEPTAVFVSLPGDTATSEIITLERSPYGSLLIRMVVTTPLEDFSLLSRGQRYS